MNASPRLTRLVGVALVGGMLATGAAACGSSSSNDKGTATVDKKQAASLSPSELLAKSLESPGAGKASTVVFKYAGTESDLDTALATSEDSAEDKALAKKILLGGSVTYTVKTTDGSTLADAQKKASTAYDADVATVADSATVFELKVVAGNLYIRADVNKIASLADKTQELQQLTPQLDQLPANLSFVKNAVQGDWLEISKADLASLKDELQKLQQQATSASPSASINAVMLASDLKGVLTKDATVTKDGDDAELGTKLVVTLQTKAVATDALAVLKKDLPQYASELSKSSTDDVKDRTVTLDVYAKDAVLTRIQVDVGQFDDKDATKPKIPLVLDFKGSAEDIAAPTTSTPIPVGQLLQQYGQQLGGLGGALSGELGGIARTASFSTSAQAVPVS